MVSTGSGGVDLEGGAHATIRGSTRGSAERQDIIGSPVPPCFGHVPAAPLRSGALVQHRGEAEIQSRAEGLRKAVQLRGVQDQHPLHPLPPPPPPRLPTPS